MKSLSEIGEILEDTEILDRDALLLLAEDSVENWILSKNKKPTLETKEGFRLLALQRQGARGDPSFNACRETCREIAYHYNLLNLNKNNLETLNMMRFVVKHIYLFISGKLVELGLGHFCCSSKSIRETINE